MAPAFLPIELAAWFALLAAPLHARSSWRLSLLWTGMLFARERRTVASWFRAAGIKVGWRSYYYFLHSFGRKVAFPAWRLLDLAVKLIQSGTRVLLALDDTPTKRFGPCVEGAGVHHNPTPGPAGEAFLYGHVWVTLALVAHHPLWGAVALPVQALLYVRQASLSLLPPWHKWKFKTKLELAVELVQWAVSLSCLAGKTVWVVADGAYAKRPFLKPVLALGVVVVSRLRKDAALWSVPEPPAPGEKRRGRPPKYGKQRIRLAGRAAHPHAWSTGVFTLYGESVIKTYKTFLATYKPAGGLIRVVLVKEKKSWVAFFCTHPEASVAEILEAVADRASLEQTYHDIKEVHGAGQQQVRSIWSNIGAFHLTLWSYALLELWAWDKKKDEICDRSASPWDEAERRPSHADRLHALRREVLKEEFSRLPPDWRRKRKIRRLIEHLLDLAA